MGKKNIATIFDYFKITLAFYVTFRLVRPKKKIHLIKKKSESTSEANEGTTLKKSILEASHNSTLVQENIKTKEICVNPRYSYKKI